jgi:hypothetical protein
VKETPPQKNKFTIYKGFVILNKGFIFKEFRRKTWLFKREYRIFDPELNPNLKINPNDYKYYFIKNSS